MEAVVNHSRTKDLYFVADGSGGHAFAETLEQHNRNVGRWRQIETTRTQQQGGKPPAEAVDKVEPPAGPDNRTEAPATTQPAADNTGSAGVPVAQPTGAIAGTRARAFDASEGTARDPLLNKSFDLNSPKQVPQLKP
jgi:UPF0755 protein